MGPPLREGWLDVASSRTKILALGCLLGGAGACYGFGSSQDATEPSPTSSGPHLRADAGVNPSPTSTGPQPGDALTDPLHDLPTGAAQLAILCARNLGDPVAKAFCANPAMPPVITSLVELQKLVGLDFKPGNITNGHGGNPAFAMTGNSSSLVARSTSAINPRALVFTPPNRRSRLGADGTKLDQSATCAEIETISPLNHLVAMGFTRGEDFVELIAKDPDANGTEGKLNFFLFKFEHTCAKAPGGCTNGDMLTPAGETNFTGSYSVYQDTDLANTIYDCKQCHQPAGPGSRKILRMQELPNPWVHFFRNNRDGGTVLMDDYKAAHGT